MVTYTRPEIDWDTFPDPSQRIRPVTNDSVAVDVRDEDQ